MTILQHALDDYYERVEDALGDQRPFYQYVHRHQIDQALAGGFCGLMAVLPIADCGNGRFDFINHVARFPAFICEAFGTDGETSIDLVAWPLDRPRHVLSMFGCAAILGAWEASSPYSYTFGRALSVHRSPLDWLKANCQGAAIVTPNHAAPVLRDLPGPIAAQDARHAQELNQMIARVARAHVVLVEAAA